MKILYYSPASYGGIADYAHEQANTIATQGVEVLFLCTPSYPLGHNAKYQMIPVLREIKSQAGASHKLLKLFNYARNTWFNYQTLAHVIERENVGHVLLGSYQEYLAPLWAPRLKKLAQQGVVFGAIVHDPVRDFILGPLWWHRWSVASGYSFLREAFVHEAISLDTVQPQPQLRTTIIPHGVYTFPPGTRTREDARQALNLPIDARVLLAFGHIRENKNLDLALRTIAHFSDLFIIIAGQEQSSKMELFNSYKDLANQLGIANRCRWEVRFIPATEVADLFRASDLTLLTYSQSFRSASGVLNTTVGYRVPCIASAGIGPLKTAVQKYSLGIWVEPDEVEALINGIKMWLTSSIEPEWDKYIRENSWATNAEIVITKLADHN